MGGKKDSRGVLLLVALLEHKYRAEVGYGLEPVINDARAGDAGRAMVPFFRQGNYSAGIETGAWQLANYIAADKGVTLTAPQPAQPVQPRDQGSPSFPIWPIFLLIFVVFHILRAIFRGATGRRGGPRGGGGWWIGPMIGGMLGGGGGFGGSSGGWGAGGGGGGLVVLAVGAAVVEAPAAVGKRWLCRDPDLECGCPAPPFCASQRRECSTEVRKLPGFFTYRPCARSD